MDDIEKEPFEEGDNTTREGSECGAAYLQVGREDLSALVEALLFVSGSPLSVAKLAAVTDYQQSEVEEALATLRAALPQRGSGLELVQVAEGYQLRTRAEFAEYIRDLKASRPKRLSAQALETLAVIAYRQPIVKSDIETIRGVDATPTLKTLADRGLVRIIGHQATAGQPALYGTTPAFLEIFGSKNLTDLPSLRDLKELESEPGEVEDQNSSQNEAADLNADSAEALNGKP